LLVLLVLLTVPSGVVAWNVGLVGVRGRGALLGPEESGRLVGAVTGFPLGLLLHKSCSCVVCGWGQDAPDCWAGPLLWGLFFKWWFCSGVCPYFENCIVDASIL
jgi:hypothetical protein